MAPRLDAAQTLAAKIVESENLTVEDKRTLFKEYAAQWCDAEEVDDTEVLGVLESARSKLKLRPPKLSTFEKLWMYFRFVLTVLVAAGGCMCLVALGPLRWMHPMFRMLGVPNGHLPMDYCVSVWSRAVLAAAGVKVRLEGKAATELWVGADRPGIIVFNHASNLDPFIVNQVCRLIAPKYVGKKALFKLPVFGWVFFVCGMVPINRGDREKAVRTMNETVGGIMRRWGRSVVISPEGTRTTDGHLVLPFKKGAFHLQEQRKVPLLPVVIRGAYELWPPSQLFSNTGEVTVSILPPQPYEEGENKREAGRLKLQRAIGKELNAHPVLKASPLSTLAAVEGIGYLLFIGALYFQFWRMYSAVTGFLGLSYAGIAVLFCAIAAVVAVVVDTLL